MSPVIPAATPQNLNQACKLIELNAQKIDAEAQRMIDAQSQQTKVKSKLAGCFSRIGNRSFAAFAQIKEKSYAMVGKLFQLVTAKTPSPAPSTQVSDPIPTTATVTKMPGQLQHLELLQFVKDERANVVSAKTLLSSLLNDGKSDPENGKLFCDYFSKNPTSHLFNSDNIQLQGDRLYFKKPIQLSRLGPAFSWVTLDMRDSTNGEFRGEVARYVLADKGLKFNSLAELCQKMTDNPQRNLSAMLTGNALAGFFNQDKLQAESLLAGQDAAYFNAFVKPNGEGLYVTKFPAEDLMQPTVWDNAGSNASHSSSTIRRASDKTPPLASSSHLSLNRRTVSPGNGNVKAKIARFESQTQAAKPQHSNAQAKQPNMNIDFNERRQIIDAALFINKAPKQKEQESTSAVKHRTPLRPTGKSQG